MKHSIGYSFSSLLLLFFFTSFAELSAQTPEQKLADLKITLPVVPEAIGNDVNVTRVGNLIFIR